VSASRLFVGDRNSIIGFGHAAIKRPGNVISPVDLDSVAGKSIIRDLKKDHTLIGVDFGGKLEK
jgi:hypothetical protein